MQLQRLKELLHYDPATGSLSNIKNSRVRYPCPDGFITVYCNQTLKKYKIKASIACWMLGNNKELPQNQKVLHKNLDSSDNRLINLTTISKQASKKLLDARRNLSGCLRLLPHPEDQHGLLVVYIQGGMERKEVLYDIGVARRRLLALQLRFAKVLNRYCLFD